MKKLIKVTTILLLAGGVMGGSYVVIATENPRENDFLAVTAVKISMNDALRIALSRVAGKPTLARLKNDHGQYRWEIEIVSTKGIYYMIIDASSGGVLGQSRDLSDPRKNSESYCALCLSGKRYQL